MNKKILLIPFVTLLTVGGLTGCNKDNLQVTNLKTAVQYMCTRKNYTLSYVGSSYAHDFVYTENSIGVTSVQYIQLTDVYVECGDGVYRLRYENDKYVAGEILSKGKNLWGNNNYQNTLFGVSTDFLSGINDEATTASVKDKTFKMRYAYSIGYKEEEIPNIDSLTLTYSLKNEKPYLRFTISYLGNDIIYEAHSFGNTTNKRVEDFISKGGTYLNPDKELKEMRDLIRANNFVQGIYYFGEESGFIANAYFNEHYYATNYYGTDFFSGAIQLKSSKYNLNGCYYFQISEGNPSLISTPVYTKPDIVEYYHYPTFLKLLDNYEFLSSWTNQDMEGITPEGSAYYLTNQSLLADFAANFSISDSFSGQRPVALGIDIVGFTSKTINFYYKFVYSGAYYVMPIPLFNFGKANIGILDSIYNQYND